MPTVYGCMSLSALVHRGFIFTLTGPCYQLPVETCYTTLPTFDYPKLIVSDLVSLVLAAIAIGLPIRVNLNCLSLSYWTQDCLRTAL